MSAYFRNRGYKENDTAHTGRIDISFLENSIYYFIKCAFIKEESSGCRLIVTHQERLLLDRLYSTVKGAKIAFAKRYGYRLWQKGVRPVWTSVPSIERSF